MEDAGNRHVKEWGTGGGQECEDERDEWRGRRGDEAARRTGERVQRNGDRVVVRAAGTGLGSRSRVDVHDRSGDDASVSAPAGASVEAVDEDVSDERQAVVVLLLTSDTERPSRLPGPPARR